MTSEQKKAYLLTQSLVLHLHDLDDDEKKILEGSAIKIDTDTELKWVEQFIAENYATALERGRFYLKSSLEGTDKHFLTSVIKGTLEAVQEKGYITESEAVAILKFAQDWRIETELKQLMNQF